MTGQYGELTRWSLAARTLYSRSYFLTNLRTPLHSCGQVIFFSLTYHTYICIQDAVISYIGLKHVT